MSLYNNFVTNTSIHTVVVINMSNKATKEDNIYKNLSDHCLNAQKRAAAMSWRTAMASLCLSRQTLLVI